jgi:hypothetical protein
MLTQRDLAIRNLREKDFQAILDRVEVEGDCHVWKGRLSRGKGRFTIYQGPQPVEITVARLVAYLAFGEAPENKPMVTTTCGNRNCLRSDHLIYASDAEVRKRRQERRR